VVAASPTAGLWAIKFKENADMRMMKKRNFVGRGEIEELALELEVVSHFTHLKDVTLWKPGNFFFLFPSLLVSSSSIQNLI
jgi:hypothetical protein